MKAIYQAGSVHHADDGGHGWRDELQERYPHLVWVNPLDKYDGNANDVVIMRENSPRGHVVPSEKELVSSADIVESDKSLIDECDAVLVGWSPSVPACGTPMEVLYAWQNDIPVISWIREDVSFEEISPWLDYHSGFMTSDIEEAVEYIGENVGADKPRNCDCESPVTVTEEIISDDAEYAIGCTECGAVELFGGKTRIAEIEMENGEIEIDGWTDVIREWNENHE